MPLPLLECATHFVRSLAALRGELAICPVVTEGNLVQVVLLIRACPTVYCACLLHLFDVSV
jgi:hypothetical protein